MQLGVPQEKIVVVRAHADEIFRAGLFVEFHQLLRVPLLGFPQRNDVLPAVGGGMAPAGQVVFVIGRALLIHLARIPVALHRHGLRPPVRPDAELGVAEPVRAGVIGQRIPGAGERSGCDGQIQRGGQTGNRQRQHQSELRLYFHVVISVNFTPHILPPEPPRARNFLLELWVNPHGGLVYQPCGNCRHPG